MRDDTQRSIDAALARAGRTGDEDAWRALHAAHARAVANFIRARLGPDRALVDDVLQETWMTAVRRIGDYDPDLGSFRAYLSGIALKVAANAQRRAGRDPVPLPEISAKPEKRPDEALSEALGRLPDRYRALLSARYADGLSVKEIADLQGETEKAIEAALGRARLALRRAMEKNGAMR